MGNLKIIGKPAELRIPMIEKDLGICGKEAPFTDSFGEKLFTGDVVEIKDKLFETKNITSVVERHDTKEIIVFGIADEYPKYNFWEVKKIKSYTEMKKGDKVKSIEYVEIKEKVENKKQFNSFRVGDKVCHEKFGKGIVVELNTGIFNDAILVQFNKMHPELHDGNDLCIAKYKDNTCYHFIDLSKLKNEDGVNV